MSWAKVEGFDNYASIVLLGEIAPGDAANLERIIRQVNEAGLIASRVRLYSNGGSLNEGLALGRIIRRYRLETQGPLSFREEDIAFCYLKAGTAADQMPVKTSEHPDCACNSACALAWLGGLFRVGSVGFHRAYLADRNANYESHESAVSHSTEAISAYLDEMRIPSFVLDRILTTDSPSLSFLTKSEQDRIKYDPVYAEFLAARCGARGPDEFYHCAAGAHHEVVSAAQFE